MFVLSSLGRPAARRVLWPSTSTGRWIFWINVPIGFAAFLMTNSQLRHLPRHERPHRLDYLGAVLLVIATVSLLLALSWGGVRYAWSAPTILSLFGVAAVVGGAFFVRLTTAREPLIPLAVLGDRVVYSATLAACFAMGTFIGLTIYVPIYLEGVVGYSAASSGLALIPLMIGTVTGATISGRSMTYFKHYKRLPMLAMAVSVLACATLAVAADRLSRAGLEVVLLFVSLGLGTILPLSTITIQNAVPLHQLGTATASMNFFRSLGGALIVAAFGTILLGRLAGGVGGQHDLGALIRGSDAAHLAAAFQSVFAAAAVGLLLAFLFLIILEERPLLDRRAAAAGDAMDEGLAQPILD